MAHHQGREIPVYGPHSVYPSGLPYFTVLDGAAGKYILAGDLDWVKKPSLRDRLTRSAIRKSPGWVAAQEPWAA
ncbi:hypothetical protein [Hoyosella subflava]|uniref:Uncharacterized protein n=1 Tax=Hoyosella subflava (strain DSM 45089 / JCM 17490 / NBRC 109087 / DQS3-9A1) TaxID=443218 RepID=F6EJX9_HOYSD|nr:hypothetical protein [Hoyosella subflava]AEF41337.1 hypothetical protein AS9A_2890 [Hoyosella subflava DQS3-9A1]